MADRKTPSFLATWTATLALAAATGACSAPDPGDIPVRKPPKPTPARFDAGNVIVGVGDGGAAGAGAFQGAPPFTQGAAELSSLHDKHTQSLIGQQNPADRNCVECHSGTGVAATAGKTFVAAGTVYLTKTGAPAQGVEVRIRAPDGSAQSSYTDTAGNWFMRTFNGTNDIPIGSIAGVRNATTYSTMVTQVGTVAGTGCAQGGTCHGSPAQGRVYLSLQ